MEYREHGSTVWRAGVDGFHQRHKTALTSFQLPSEGNQMAERAGQPVEPPDHESVVRAQRAERRVQLGATLSPAQAPVGEDPNAAPLAERLDLAVRILACRREPCVADGHFFILPSRQKSRQTDFRIAFVTVFDDYVLNVAFPYVTMQNRPVPPLGIAVTRFGREGTRGQGLKGSLLPVRMGRQPGRRCRPHRGNVLGMSASVAELLVEADGKGSHRTGAALPVPWLEESLTADRSLAPRLLTGRLRTASLLATLPALLSR